MTRQKQEYEQAEKKESKKVAESLDPLVREWFFSRFKDFSLTQLYGVLPIFERKNILISAPTGGTKTLTAFLSIINYLVILARKNELDNRVYAVYVSPLKALSNDIYVNLIRPLEEIEELAMKKGIVLQKIHVGLRTGDTDVKERAKQAKNAPHILVTTPESLAIIINSPKFSLKFEMLEWLIVDEIHSLAENKRGVHLSLTLERVQELSKIEICRIGLSATIHPIEKVANFLVGEGRECEIAMVELEKGLDLQVKSAVSSFLDTNSRDFSTNLYELLNDLIEKHKTTLIFTNTRAATERVVNTLKERFPKTYVETIESEEDFEISEKKEEKIEKDLEKEWENFEKNDLFEKKIANLKEKNEKLEEKKEKDKKNDEDFEKIEKNQEKLEENVKKEGFEASELKKEENYEKIMSRKTESYSNIGAHHSSLSKELRFDLEKRLREGKLKVVVCSTSLELGIDIGYVDLVVLLSSPKSVARALQRIGRAGHKLGAVAKGIFIVNDFDDLIECCVIQKNGVEKKIDSIHIHDNCLDILSQHIFGMAINRVWKKEEMFKLIKKSYCYRNLEKEDFMSVISYLSGEYELEERHVYAKIWYDAEKDEIGKRGKLARVLYMTNIGTIPDESFVNVIMNNKRIGQVDENFLEKIRRGDVFVLGGNKYMYMYAKGMNIYVKAAEGKKPNIPIWVSEMLPLSFDSAISIGRFRRLIEEKLLKEKKTGGDMEDEIVNFIKEYCYVDKKIASEAYEYMKAQFDYSIIAHDMKIVIEEYRERKMKDIIEGRSGDEKKFIFFHTMFGRRVNDALSRAVAYGAARVNQRDVEVGITDNGFYISGENVGIDKAEKILKQIKKENLKEILSDAIEKTEVLKRRFRHCAGRSLMILMNYKGRVKSVGKQQMSSHFLLASVKKKTKDFPILKEARREVLEDLMDIKSAELILDFIQSGKIKVEKKETRTVSPFAVNLLLRAHSDIIKIEDKMDFIKRVYQELRLKK